MRGRLALEDWSCLSAGDDRNTSVSDVKRRQSRSSAARGVLAEDVSYHCISKPSLPLVGFSGSYELLTSLSFCHSCSETKDRRSFPKTLVYEGRKLFIYESILPVCASLFGSHLLRRAPPSFATVRRQSPRISVNSSRSARSGFQHLAGRFPSTSGAFLPAGTSKHRT